MTVGGEDCNITYISGNTIECVPPEEEPQETFVRVSIVSVLQTLISPFHRVIVNESCNIDLTWKSVHDVPPTPLHMRMASDITRTRDLFISSPMPYPFHYMVFHIARMCDIFCILDVFAD